MLVIPDANALFSDPFLAGANGRAILQAKLDLGLSVGFAEIVLDEIRNKIRDRFQASAEKAREARQELTRVGADTANLVVPDDAEVETVIAQFNKHIDRLAPPHSIYRLEFPNPDHRDLAKRAIRKQRPFLDHDNGYRDTLLWLSILDFLANNPDESVVLVTDDHGFTESREVETLHPDLVSELQLRGFDQARISIRKNLSRVVTDYVTPAREELEQLKEQIEDHQIEAFSDDSVDIAINDWISGSEPPESIYDGDSYATEFDVAEDIVLEDVTDVWRISGTEIFVSTTWTSEVTFLLQRHGFGTRSVMVPMRFTVDSVLNGESYELIAHDVIELEETD